MLHLVARIHKWLRMIIQVVPVRTGIHVKNVVGMFLGVQSHGVRLLGAWFGVLMWGSQLLYSRRQEGCMWAGRVGCSSLKICKEVDIARCV